MGWKRVVARGVGELCATWRMRRPARGARILLYHTIGTRVAADTYGMDVTPERFQAHLMALKHARAVQLVPLDPEWIGPGDDVRVALTFDDGYRDTLTRAAPLLVELGIPFTVFVVPAYVQSGHADYLDTDQLRELAALPGCRIGSHGMHHYRLTGLDEETLIRELAESRHWLEDFLSKPVTAVAYPCGAVDERVRAAAARCGYTLGVCSRAGINRGVHDPLRLRRTEIVGRDTPRVFSQKLRGAWDWRGMV